MKLVFATNNPHKMAEVQALVAGRFSLLSLQDIGCTEELAETGHTLDANAREKAEYVHKQYGGDVFAEDTGLEVRALSGAPGVYSARYAGPQRSASDNTAKLLAELAGKEDRSARFRTVIALVLQDTWYQFEGICEGYIGLQASGDGGFGYDPVFFPRFGDQQGLGDQQGAPWSERSFAAMSQVEKAGLSHRGKAIRALTAFLHTWKA
jgi:XTP/dITP diphosphohydrolase